MGHGLAWGHVPGILLGDTGFDQAMMLEEVEMPPANLRKIMGFTSRTARRTRVTLTYRGLGLKAKLARRL